MWLISHPEKITLTELESYDHIFVSSRKYLSNLKEKIHTPTSLLQEFVDTDLFFYDPDEKTPASDLFFAGNSRKQYREVVKFSVEANLPISVLRWIMGRDRS